MTIRNIEPQDIDAILALNETYVDVLSPLDKTKLLMLSEMAALAVVIEHDKNLAGFLIALSANEAYKSTNYQWFKANYDSFLYIDRIVVSSEFQGNRLASKLYQHAIESASALNVPRVVAEIDILPPNKPSLLFHEKIGFKQVGVLTHSKTKEVSLQELKLPNF